MRRRITIVAAGLAVITAVVAAIVLVRDDGEGSSTESLVPGLESRTVDAGEVDVKIEPRQLDDQGAVFAISLDTHSVELSADLARTAVLDVDGVDWPDATWSGDQPGGHHREGELRFEPGGPATGTVQLSIGGLDEPVEASWTLEG